MLQEIDTKTQCYHCGQSCADNSIVLEDKSFCCQGCKTVYEILKDNDLCEYYAWESAPGASQRFVSEESYSFLEETSIQKKILSFRSDTFCKISFFVPTIHCMSCIWLLENLQKLGKGILHSEVNFSKKLVTIDFNPTVISLGALARLMASIGYAPSINLETEREPESPQTRSLVVRLAVAGFCFGNIMLLSFPEYLGVDGGDGTLKTIFSYLNLVLALPVVIFSAQEYFGSAFRTFRQRQINIDVPIAIGLAALFLRSSYDIISQSGPGYLDSLTGLVFFLLIGRWFQSKTFDSLAFDRDYKSYFPLAIHKLEDKEWKPVLVYELKEGDLIRVRNMEIIPADSLLKGKLTFIDYSFVTGESRPVEAVPGDLVYAGGRIIGEPAEMVVRQKTSQSHLTSLWNKDPFQKSQESKYRKIIDKAARKFTWAVLGLALLTGVYWQQTDPSQLWLVITSVLMVACPCALALAAPFTFGSMMRAFGRNGMYLKNADVIERMASIDSIVFDKTGTVTSGASDLRFVGALDDQELGWVRQLTASSSHPLSNLITKSLPSRPRAHLSEFTEIPGKGIEAKVAGIQFKVGSAAFVGYQGNDSALTSKVFVSMNNLIRGYFLVDTTVRREIELLIPQLKSMPMTLLSGDTNNDHARMIRLFPVTAELKFNQSPHDKMEYVSNLQKKGRKVMMVGDGLNDSGALRQSDVGIAVADDTGAFTPACDAIIEGSQLGNLAQLITLSKRTVTILKTAFAISFFYNFIALSIAVTGHLSPLVAAILMPVSSISVVGFSTIAVNSVARSLRRKAN